MLYWKSATAHLLLGFFLGVIYLYGYFISTAHFYFHFFRSLHQLYLSCSYIGRSSGEF